MRTSKPRRAASMADDFGAFPLDCFEDERLDGAPLWAIHGFTVILGIADDHGRFDGRASALAGMWRCATAEAQELLDFLHERKLIDFYEVPGRGGVKTRIGEVVEFYSYRGHTRRRKNPSDRRVSSYPDRNGECDRVRPHRPAPRPETTADRVPGDTSTGATDSRQRSDTTPTDSRQKGDDRATKGRVQSYPQDQPTAIGQHQGRREGDKGATQGRARGDLEQREIETETEKRGRASQPAPSVYMQDQYAYEDRARQGGADANAPLVGGRVLAPRTGVDRHEQQEPPDGYSASQPEASPSSRARAEAPPDEPVAPARDRARIMADFEALKARVANPDAVPIRPRAPDPLPKLRLPWPSVEHETAALAAGRVFESRPGGRRLQASLVVLHGYATRPEFLAHCAAIAAQGDAWAGWEQGDAWDGLAFMFGDGVPDSIGPASSHERPVLEVLPGGAG